MPYTIENGMWRSVFAVPCEIIDLHLKLCGKTQLKALLALLRHDGELGVSALAAMIGEKEADVRDAVEYWTQLGVLQSSGAQALPALQYVCEPSPAPAPAKTKEPAPRRVETITTGRRRFERDEINRLADEDENVAWLLQEAQAVLGKTLGAVATDTIAALYSYYGMRPDVIMMALQYCVGIGKANMRYIEKVAASWIEAGIETHEQAEEEIRRRSEQHTLENRVKSAFGIYDRALVPSEKKYIDAWFHEFGYDIPLITLAFERCVEVKGKLSFPYINGILSNWRAKGVTTPAEAMRETKEAAKPASPRQKAAKPSSYDLGELEELLEQGSF